MQPLETIHVDEDVVGCDGGGGALGHPLVYLTITTDGRVDCPYCGRRFVLTGEKAFVTNGPITAHQEASFAEVVKNYDLVGRTFRGHREVPGNSTACPGDIIMEKIVRKYRNG